MYKKTGLGKIQFLFPAAPPFLDILVGLASRICLEIRGKFQNYLSSGLRRFSGNFYA